MAGRFSLLLLILASASGGCASVSDERIAKLEATVVDLQVQEIRIAALEDKLNALLAGQLVKDPPATRAPVQTDFRTEPGKTPEAAAQRGAGEREPAYGPRRVEPSSAPAQPKSGAAYGAGFSARASGDYRRALSTLESGRPAAAMPLFKDFLQAHPDHDLAPNAGYWLGECYYTLKQYDSAIIAFKDVVAQHPSHAKAADAMLKAGFSYAQLGDTANARFYLDALLKDYPASRSAALARERLTSL